MIGKRIFYSFVCFLSLGVGAFDYFDSNHIEYWEKMPKEKKSINKANKEGGQKPSFNWKDQLDPQKESFFREGSHTPPAAVIELMRNPTDQNIKNWFALIEKKNNLAQRLHQRIAEYVRKNKSTLEKEEINLTKSNLVTLSKESGHPRRFRFRLYFESHCSHCNRMIETMKELQELGYYVEIRQIDDNKKALKALPFPVSKASARELSEKKINTWPVLLVGDLKKKLVYRLDGYLSTRQVLSSINK